MWAWKAVHISPFYFLSNFYSSEKFFVSLSDFDQSCWTSAYLLPLKSLNIISRDFLLAFQLEPCKTIFWHTFWCFSRSLTYSFYLPSDFKACNVWQPSLSWGFFYWLGEVAEIRWQMLQQHWSHIPTLGKIASVALLITCFFMAASGTGGSLSKEDGLQSCSTERGQGHKEGTSPGLRPAFCKVLRF